MKFWQLQQMQALDLNIKIKKSLLRIKEWLDYWDDMAYISFSGGKDSTVLLDLVKRVNPNIPIVFCNTGIQFPEIRRFVYRFIENQQEKRVINKYGYKQEYFKKDNFIIIYPKYSFRDVVEQYGYPVISKEQAQYIYAYNNSNSIYVKKRVLYGNDKNSYRISNKWLFLLNAPFKISDKCCKIMKVSPFIRYEKETNRKPFVGTLVGESSFRLNSFLRNGGCNSFESKRPMSKPLSFWTEHDILNYIRLNKVPYSKIYGDIVKNRSGELMTTGRDRTGCIYCGFGVHLESEPNRFQKMKRTHPRLYNYCMYKLGMANVLEYISVPY